jgi:eukaryotic-like serine/threonine-protein kinase
MAAADPERVIAGRYRLHAVIGRGGMGAVWLARDELLNRDVAVKEIVWPAHTDAVARQVARRGAVREAQLAARIDHPNVVRVYDIVEGDDWTCIAMELLPYPSLRDVLRDNGPMSPGDAARVGLGVLAALRVVHDAGVVHRDVKPANILIGPEGQVVLSDFGIAKSIESLGLTTSGVLVGSPQYIAPERARGGRAGTAADLWALGVSLYAAVEGQPPFQRSDVLASLTAVVADEPDPPAHAGPLEPVISGLLRKDPGTRLGIDEAERMLRRVTGGAEFIPRMTYPADGQATGPQQEAAWPPAPAPRGARRRRRRPALAGLAIAAAIAVMAAAIAFLAVQPQDHPTASPAGLPTASPAGLKASPSTPATTVPAGYYRYTDPTGFSIGVPAGWQISHAGHYVYITDPANGGIFLLIDQSDQPEPNALTDWQQQAAARQSSYPDYHLIVLRAVSYPQAAQAADWEFSYDRNGVPVQILNRNVLANARHAYALYWSTPVSDWNAYYRFFRVFAATFRPAGA